MLARSVALLAYRDLQPFNFLIERGKWDSQILGRVGLAPVDRLQRFDDFPALEIGDNFEQRCVGWKATAFITPDAEPPGLKNLVRQDVGRHHALGG
jgi:hypothetical protein